MLALVMVVHIISLRQIIQAIVSQPYILILLPLNMDELCDIISNKLTIINSNKDFKTMTVAEKDKLLDNLMIEKKKETLRVLVQTQLQQAIATRHILCDEEIKEIVTKTHELMKIHVQHLDLKIKEKPIEELLHLYLAFFSQVGGTQRVKQIQNLAQKKLCPESLVPSTLFNWLVEWTRKQFKEYLKTSIHSLYVDSRQPIHFSHKEEDKESPQKKNQQKAADPFLIIHRKSIIQDKSQRQTAKDRKEMPRSLEDLRVGSPINSSLKRLQKFQGPVEESGPINRQVFLYAFTDQFQNYYKSVEDCLSDLEAGWARRLKKGGRREQVLRRIPEVASSCIKQMSQIKQSIDAYSQYYKSSHLKLMRQKSPKSPRTEPAEQDKLSLQKEGQMLKRKKKKKQIDVSEQAKEGKARMQSNASSIDLVVPEGERLVSTTDRKAIDRRQQLLNSFNKKQRYEFGEQYGSESNLLPSSSKSRKREEYSLDISHKTIDLSLGGDQHQQSRILWLNSSRQSNELEIIEERVKKMKLKVMHGRPLRGSVSKNKAEKRKRENSRSFDLREGNSIEYRSLPVQVEVEEKEQVKLPQIKRRK